MSVLPTGQPLRRVLPDMDDLLTDPHAYLRTAPLAIGARQMYGLAGLFALPGIALLVSCLFLQKPEVDRVALGVGLLVGSAVWVGWSLLLRGHEIVLHPDGVEVNYRGSSVWAPWALFRVEGRAFVPPADSPMAGLILPINRAAIGAVVLRRDGLNLASGLDIQCRQLQFTGLGEVVLSGRYEVASGDLGELLLWLGGQLGQDLPPGTPPIDLPQQDADPAGWIVVSLTRFRLPVGCCGCGGPRDSVLYTVVAARGDWVMQILTGTRQNVEIGVPVCDRCREAIVGRQRRGGTFGLLAGGSLGAALCGITAGLLADGRMEPLLLGTLLGLAVGGLAGLMTGLLLSLRLPVRFRRYAPVKGTLEVRFDNPEVAASFLASRDAEAPGENETT
jgi:hypothetical protein